MTYRPIALSRVSWYPGNGYAQIERGLLNRPLNLWPLHPFKTFPVRDTVTGDLFYKTSDGMRSW